MGNNLIATAASLVEIYVSTSCTYMHKAGFKMMLLKVASNPTLSYTQRLEARVKELEYRLRVGPGPHSLGNSPTESTERSLSTFSGLTVDQTGKVSFHGPTSILSLPLRLSRAHGDGDSSSRLYRTENETAEQWREQLISNAWVQREAESSSADAVSYMTCMKEARLILLGPFQFSSTVSSRIPLDLDPPHLQLSLQTSFHP